MGQYTSYYLYQKYETRGSQEAIPVYPNVYSIDADGTRERVVKIQDDPQCGYDPPIKPIYKWVNIPITQDYICDDCPEYQTRWVRTDETICSGTPTPTVKKLVANYSDGKTLEVECNSNTELTTGDTKPSGYQASAMTNAVIGGCVTSIGIGAFIYCGLTGITIPNSVTTIGHNAFQDCSGLTNVVIPNSVTIIDYGVFNRCLSLVSVTIPNGITSIGRYAFAECKSLVSVTIPNSVTTIGDEAFYKCGGLTSAIIGNNVTTIGTKAFRWCSGLTSVSIPDSVTTIGESAFYVCSGLTSVTIGSGVTSIGMYAFNGCSSLQSITCLAVTPPTLDNSNAFDYTNNCPIYVPSQSVSVYKSTGGWSYYANRIQPIP